jgi:hypothetical protein
MKVFLSWSGEVSRKVAAELHTWLPYILQRAKPFLSSDDISKGARWSDVLASELQEASYGIICVTPYNIHKPWINFEAGALSKFISRQCIAPMLFDFQSTADVRGPLAQFQLVLCTKEEIFKLVDSINNEMSLDEQIGQDILKKTFEVWWKELERGFNDIRNERHSENRTEYEWLCLSEDLSLHGTRDGDKSIWIITSNIFDSSIRTDVKDHIEHNIQNGMTYRYLIPTSTGSNQNEKDTLMSMASSYCGKLQVKEFDNELFYSQAPTDYIIINPILDNYAPLRVFLKLPVEEETEYWIKAQERSGHGFRDRFDQLWREHPISASPLNSHTA